MFLLLLLLLLLFLLLLLLLLRRREQHELVLLRLCLMLWSCWLVVVKVRLERQGSLALAGLEVHNGL